MTGYVLAPEGVVSVEVKGTADRFPVRRIYCVARNYAAHAREMGMDPDREPPFFFAKPADAIVEEGHDFPYPPKTTDVHHEMELVVAIGKGGANIAAASALDHVFGYAAGLDMTRRDLQAAAKKQGRPWDTAKGFDHAAPCSRIMPAARIGHPSSGAIWLKVNGELRQNSDLSQLIWNIPEVIASLSALFTLGPGDLIYTGTPAGVAAVQRGDVLEGGVDNVGSFRFKVV